MKSGVLRVRVLMFMSPTIPRVQSKQHPNTNSKKAALSLPFSFSLPSILILILILLSIRPLRMRIVQSNLLSFRPHCLSYHSSTFHFYCQPKPECTPLDLHSSLPDSNVANLKLKGSKLKPNARLTLVACLLPNQ